MHKLMADCYHEDDWQPCKRLKRFHFNNTNCLLNRNYILIHAGNASYIMRRLDVIIIIFFSKRIQKVNLISCLTDFLSISLSRDEKLSDSLHI